MAKAARKKPVAPMIVFSRARDIPFNRIRLSDSNVRETDVEAGLDELTHDIDRREDLVQGLNVRAILDEDGNETGDFETPAGGRRYRSIARLVEAGRFPADGLVPCIVKKADAKTSAVDDSLAENLLRLALHPLDQFKAFKRMFDMGMSKEEIADAWRTTPRYIMQRLRLATVAPALHDAYARNEMTLAMLEAFTVNPDHERQQQVWERISTSWQKEPWHIRNMLTETTVPAADKRARFVGIDAYEAAGGPVLRDLFSEENGGWLQDVTLLDRLVDEKLRTVADEIAGQGWKWIDAAVELPYGHTNGLRRLVGVTQELTDEERATREALRDEYDELEAQYAEAQDLPDEVDQRLGEIEAELDAFENRPISFAPEDIARAGVFVSIGREGELIVSPGYVRPEDEQPETVDGEDAGEGADPSGPDAVQRAVITVGGEPVPDADEEEDDAVKPLPERLVTDLTAWRTLALRNALAENPRVAMTALLHKLVLDTFERTATSGTSLYAAVRHIYLPTDATGLADSAAAKMIDERADAWRGDIPTGDDDRLWDWIDGLDDASRLALLAHCVSFGVNALYERPNPYSGNGISQHGLDRRMAEAERLAQATGLDLVEAGWRPMPGLAGLGLGGQPDGQNRHTAFLNGPVDRQTVAPDRVTPPHSPWILQAGAVIPAALITGIRSDLPGQITAQVTENVYDSPTGSLLLIPQGTRIIGQYDDGVTFGQRRVLLVWNRLILPGGRSIILERLPGADASGYAGLEDGVDYHWWDLMKAAGLSTLLAVGTELATSDEDRLIRAIRDGAQDTVNQAGQQIVQRQLQVAPTLTIRPGFPVRIIVTRDLVFEPAGG